MSSAVVSTPAALGRPFVFEDEAEAELCLPSTASRASLDRTAGGGCPHMTVQGMQESPLARIQSSISNRQSKISPASVTPASQLEIRPAPEMVSSGVPAIDALTGGLPRGCLTEICGPASSGRTTLLLAALAAATRRGEFCVVVDASDALDPQSAADSGIELDRLLWVRCGDDAPRKNSSPQSHRNTEKHGNQKDENQKIGCPISRAPFAREACPEPVEWVGISSVRGAGIPSQHAFDFDQLGARGTGAKENAWKENASRQSDHRMEQVLRATDLLLESGGFGLIVLDLGDLPPQSARRIPLTTWFRFRRAIEHTPTILLVIEPQPIAGSCSSLLLQLGDSRQPGAIPCGTRPVATPFFPALTCRANEFRRFATEASTTYSATNIPEFTAPAHAQLLTGLHITAELIRSRLDRKPARSIAFETKTAWAG
jgi:recombination protein RecA